MMYSETHSSFYRRTEHGSFIAQKSFVRRNITLYKSGQLNELRKLHFKDRFAHSMLCPCRAHVVTLPCRAANGLDVSFPFDLHSAAVCDSHLPCRAHVML